MEIIIIQLNRLGDIVNTLPLAITLGETYKDCRITLVCSRQFSRLFTGSPAGRWIHRYILFDAGEPGRLLPLNKYPDAADSPHPELYEKYDIAINLVFGDQPAALLSQLNAGSKFGQMSSRKGETRLGGDWAKYLFSCIPYRQYNLFNHTDLFTRCGGVSNRVVTGYITCTAQQELRATELLKEKGFRGGLLVAFQLGASEAMRRWEVEKFVHLGQRLKEYNDAIEILLLGSREETGLASRFLELASFPAVDLVGHTDILELPAVLKKCRLLVSNDTGSLHLGSAVGTPVLGLYFVAAYFAETGPYGAGNLVVQAEPPCLPCVDYYNCSTKACREFVNPAAVSTAAIALLENRFDTAVDYPNLAVYRSRFMDNGSLIYLPVMRPPHKPLSTKFQQGLIYRIMWEDQADIPGYITLVCREFPGMLQSEEFRELTATYIKELENIAAIFSIGAAACDSLMAKFSEPARLKTADLTKPLTELNIIEGFLDKREEPLSPVKHYFNFEMMDMEYLQFPALAGELKKKYSKLRGLTASFLKNLHTLVSLQIP